jgi:hypothetical protein
MSVLPTPPVEPTRGRYTDKASLSQFSSPPGSTDPMSVLPITRAGLYIPPVQNLGFMPLYSTVGATFPLLLLNPRGGFKNQP